MSYLVERFRSGGFPRGTPRFRQDPWIFRVFADWHRPCSSVGQPTGPGGSCPGRPNL